jgi:Flp pilus assembly protein TadG
MSLPAWVRARLGSDSAERGTAIIEFVFVAVLVMVPLVYLIVAVAVAQRSSLAVTNAAREAGRAFATADTERDALARAQVAARLAMADQGVSDGPIVRYVAAGTSCDAAAIVPQLTPRTKFTVCVTRSFGLPGVPSILTGRGITTVGAYEVHIDDFRAAR